MKGWDGDPAYWRAENGSLIGQTTDANPLKENTFVIWRGGEPADFELKLEYRMSATNSGIQFRSTQLPQGTTTGPNPNQTVAGKWVLKGEPALVDSTSPRYGEKASYYSAVCLETGEVEAMPLDGKNCAETPVAFLQQLRANHTEPLIVIWDNGPAHGGDAVRAYLTTPNLQLRLVRLPAYSPDFNPDEAIWGWVREEVTANTCFGTKAKVQQHVGQFFCDIAHRTDEVKRRCRRTLQAQADALAPIVDAILQQPDHVDPTLALV